MSITNKYVKRSRISEAKFREFVRYFFLDLDAQQIAFLIRLNRNTVNRYLNKIRERIAAFCEKSSPFQGEIEIDESYFGARRVKGKGGRGAYGKTPVFGIFQRGGHVYTRSTDFLDPLSYPYPREYRRNQLKLEQCPVK